MEAYREVIIASAAMVVGAIIASLVAAWSSRNDIRLPAKQRQTLRGLTARAETDSDKATVIAALACYDLLLRVREDGDEVVIMCDDGSFGPFPTSREEFRAILDKQDAESDGQLARLNLEVADRLQKYPNIEAAISKMDEAMADKKPTMPPLDIFNICPACQGTGTTYKINNQLQPGPCEACNGKGKLERNHADY